MQSALRAFELVLLRECGLLPDLAVVTQTQRAVQAGERYALLPDTGVAPARAGDAGLAGCTLVGLQAALGHGSMAALRQACRPALPELKAALRGLVHYHLGTASLRTRRVMMDLQSIANGPAR